MNEEKEQHAKENQTLKKNYLKSQARALLAELAKDAHSVSDLLRLDEVNLIQYDEEKMEVDKNSVETFVNEIKLKKPWMFGSVKLPSMADGKPVSTVKTKSIGQMNQSEKLEALKNGLRTII